MRIAFRVIKSTRVKKKSSLWTALLFVALSQFRLTKSVSVLRTRLYHHLNQFLFEQGRPFGSFIYPFQKVVGDSLR